MEQEKKRKKKKRPREQIEKQRWHLYLKGLSDTEIARQTGTSRQAIREWRIRRMLPPNICSDYLNGIDKAESICWYCVHAYADDCFSVPFAQRDWVQAYVYWPCRRDVKGGTYMIYKVLGCEKYERGGRDPLRRSPSWNNAFPVGCVPYRSKFFKMPD